MVSLLGQSPLIEGQFVSSCRHHADRKMLLELINTEPPMLPAESGVFF